VRDTGAGMTEDVRKKIFDPFFTTKEVGKGTGLGLSISFGIIQKHNGEIEVFSNPGEGTEFIIRIPVNQQSTT
jgi:signal transduction histidine kinase